MDQPVIINGVREEDIFYQLTASLIKWISNK